MRVVYTDTAPLTIPQSWGVCLRETIHWCCGIILSVNKLTTSLTAACILACAHAAEVLTSAAAVTHAVACARSNGTFRVCGRIVYARDDNDSGGRVFVAEDASGAALVMCGRGDEQAERLSPGDVARFEGEFRINDYGKCLALSWRCHLVSHGEPPAPTDATITDLLDGKLDFKPTRITGTLRDATFSETFPGWIILVICAQRERIFVSVQGNAETLEQFRSLIGAKVSATGVCTPSDSSARMKVGRTFKVAHAADVTALKPQTEDDERIPELSSIISTRESEIAALGYHQTKGRVVAAWQGKKALVRTDDGTFVGLEFAKPPLPRFGETIRAVGLPESDLFRFNLVNASWKTIAPPTPDTLPPIPVTPAEIIKKLDGHSLVNSSFHGRPVSIVGVVRSLSSEVAKQMHIECDGHLLLVDAGVLEAMPNDLVVGSRIKVSGTCILERGEHRSPSAFPQLKDFLVVLRTPDDVVVLDRPPWWTANRLLGVIGVLVAVLFGVVVANWLQKRKAALLARLATDLKVEERTRLAVELHDSLAQNLTGVSFEIDTAEKLADESLTAMHEHLGRAARTLKSCRDELRNCLWDLRNRALEESSMDEAIRQTLAPHVAGVEVAIRFNVPRERISDNTAHAILRIIRELTINAIRHGHATKIWIAGGVDGEKMVFSVRDNGSGFDPAVAPGFAEGHYGLVGISERIEAFEGEFSVESAPGKGTRAAIAIKLPHAASPSQTPQPS